MLTLLRLRAVRLLKIAVTVSCLVVSWILNHEASRIFLRKKWFEKKQRNVSIKYFVKVGIFYPPRSFNGYIKLQFLIS